MYYLTFYLESTRAKIDFYSERLKQLAGTSFPAESNNDELNKGKFYPTILTYDLPTMSYILGQANVSSSSKEEEKGKESEKKDNEADEKGRFIC